MKQSDEAARTSPDEVMLKWDTARAMNEYVGGVGLTALAWLYGLLFLAIAVIVVLAVGPSTGVVPGLVAVGFAVGGVWMSARRRRFAERLDELTDAAASKQLEESPGDTI